MVFRSTGRARRALLTGAVTISAALLATSCSSGDAGNAPATQADRTIAFVGALTPNVYYDAAECGFKKEAQARNVKVLVNTPSTFSAQAQVGVLQTLMTRQPNGIALGPAVDTAVAATINSAAAQNIPVAVFANPAFDAQALTFINADVNAATKLGVEEMAKLLPSGGEVAIIGLQPNSGIDSLRVNGYKSALAEHPDLKLVTTEYSGVNTAAASQMVASILQAHPDVKGLLVTSGTPTTGTATQVTAMNKVGQIKVIGYDASPTAVEAVKQGSVQGVVSQYPQQAGKLALDSILDKLDGKDVPNVQNYKPFLITPENVNTDAGKEATYQSCS